LIVHLTFQYSSLIFLEYIKASNANSVGRSPHRCLDPFKWNILFNRFKTGYGWEALACSLHRDLRTWSRLGLPYVRFFPDMSGILVAKYASGRNVKKCFSVRDLGIMHLMKSNRNDFTVTII